MTAELLRLIIFILSNQRQTHQAGLPQSLAFHTILTLVQQNFSPQEASMAEHTKTALDELQAKGEVLSGIGNRFCMAPPTILVENESNLTEVSFRGDRAYLKLAHQALETGQPIFKTQLHPKIHGFHRIQERLRNHGIRLLTIMDSVSHLPTPEKPKLHLLSGAEWHENPFQCWSTSSLIQAYRPTSQWQTQRDRWQFITQTNLTSDSLLKLSTGEYLWFAADQFYQLSPDTASLAMFWLDKQAGLPLLVEWDKEPGRLNLQGTILPSSYAQWLWRLSKPDPNQPRTRLFEPTQRAVVHQAFTRLNCFLV